MTSLLSIQAMTFTDPTQRSQTSMSILNSRLSRWAQSLETAAHSLTGQLNPLFQRTLIGTIVRVEHALFRLAHLNKKTLFHFRELSISSVI